MPIIATDKQMRPRSDCDFYPTPFELCYEALKPIIPGDRELRILDPGAGTGVWGYAASSLSPALELWGVEWRVDAEPSLFYEKWITGDALAVDFGGVLFDRVIGNPPYGKRPDGTKDLLYAEKFVRRGYDLLAPGGVMAYLLRVEFLAGQKRGASLWRDMPPYEVAICSRRPSFTGDGGTDATDYAVFYWQKTPRELRGDSVLSWLDWDYKVKPTRSKKAKRAA